MGERKVVCVTQARMTSTRLPGKVLMPVCGRPLLDHHLERLSRARRVHEVVLATTTNATDDPLLMVAAARGIRVVRGPEDDVLHRYALAAEAAQADILVRVTSDCPLIDPGLVDQVIETFANDDASDYCGLDTESFPRGLDVEVFRRADLDAADRDPATVAYEREHVTPYIYGRPRRFRLSKVSNPEPLPRYRWCVDEPSDFELIRRLLEAVLPEHPQFTWRDCVAQMRLHPEWAAINAHVQQKHL